jgi:hypothetical protein
MLQSVESKGMTRSQVELVERALREVTRIDPPSWDEIPVRLHPYFARYMSHDCWTGGPDLSTLRDAALLILRDAITRSGEFADDTF